jgi:hypothetical protein
MLISEKLKRLLKLWPATLVLLGVILTMLWVATLIWLFAHSLWTAF